jgi:hypothetical protein
MDVGQDNKTRVSVANTLVTPETYIRAESDRQFGDVVQWRAA